MRNQDRRKIGITTFALLALLAIVVPWQITTAQDTPADGAAPADAVPTDVAPAEGAPTDAAPADGAEAAAPAAPAEDLAKLQVMREEEDPTLPEAIFAAVNARVSANEAAQTELAAALRNLLKTPDGFTLQGSGSGGMSGYPGGSMPMSSPPMYSPGPGSSPEMSGMSGMSGPPVQQKNTVLKPIPIAVVYACVHGLFQLKAAPAEEAIQAILTGNEAVEEDRIATGLVIWEMARRYAATDQATLLKCIVKPTDFRKASAAPIATVGGNSSGYPGGSSGGYPGSSTMRPGLSPYGGAAKADPLSAQDIQQLAATAMLLTHPTRPAQMAIAKQIVSPTCDAALRQAMLTLMNASQPMQFVTMKRILAADDPDTGTRASFAMMLTRSEISELPAIMGLTPTSSTMFDGSGISVSTENATNRNRGGYPGSGSGSPMNPYPSGGYPDGSSSMYPGGTTYPGGSPYSGMGGNQVDIVSAMAKMKPGSQEYVTASLQQMFVGRLSQNSEGSSRGNEFATAMGQILQLDPGLLMDVAQLMGNASSGNQDDPAAIFWNADAIKAVTKPLTVTKSPERGPALIQLVTTPTSAARQNVWKYLKLNESKGPGDFLAIGVGEKLMPDPSLLISVKSLANTSGRRRDVPLSSAITFAVAGNQTNRAGSGYPNPSMVSGNPATTNATSEGQIKQAAQLDGRTSWAAFSDYLRHWLSQRLVAEDIDDIYTRVPEKARPYELPPDAEILHEYRCVLPSMIPEDKGNVLDQAKIKIDPTYIYFVRFRCSERGTNTRISFYNSQLKKGVEEGATPAYETFSGSGYWLDWIGINPKTGYPRSVDVYIRPEKKAFESEKPLAILATTNQNTPKPSGYGSSPTPVLGSSGTSSSGQRAEGGDPMMLGMLGNYLGGPLPTYYKAAPTALIIDVLVVECRASADPTSKPAASAKTAKSAKSAKE